MTHALPRVRELCLALPEVTEKLSHGSPTFFVRKVFVSYVDRHHGDPRTAIWCAAPAGAQEALVAAQPEVYFRPPYVGHRGWLGVDLKAVEADELEELIQDAYREVAPKRLAALLDSPPDPR